MSIGDEMYKWATDLFPYNRSITGKGVRQTLTYIKSILPNLRTKSIPTGEKVFDWTIPEEWNVESAYIITPEGKKIANFEDHNLHLVGYSESVNTVLTLDELQNHLYSISNLPEAIPYVTSYYKKQWGFCLQDKIRKKLSKGEYKAVINSSHTQGYLNYGEILIKGRDKKEILISTYVCHPSMGNNEISGICVTTALASWLNSVNNLRYSYRILFIPETIGSIAYISKHEKEMKENIVAGFVVTCVGDNLAYSFLPSREGDTLADKVSRHVLAHQVGEFISYSFLERGSDERQYCCPLIDLPVVSVMRSKYGTYPEYHTSLDDLSFISAEGMSGSYKVLKRCIESLEANHIYKKLVKCEPQLGRRGLYPNISQASNKRAEANMMNFIAYCDGEKSLLEIAEIIKAPIWELIPISEILIKENIIEKC
ncbi:MAG: DUF4910 domain-containing protein [Pseudomonadales bacterium]|nr:DUF4910 domain-containing protein [Pseudomonadales bacterium]